MPPASDHQSNIELVHAARNGDREALDVLLGRFRTRLLDRIRLMMGDRARTHAESTDFLQATFAAVVQRIDLVEVRDDRDVLRWMTWIARNAIRDGVRSDRDTSFDTLSISLAARASGSGSRATPSKEVEKAELVLRVAEALEELPQEQRAVVCLRDFDRLTFREIGGQMGSSEDRARLLYRRALVHLGQVLRDYGS